MKRIAVACLTLAWLAGPRAQAAPLPKPVLLIDEFERKVMCVAVSPDSKLIAAGGDDGKVRLWSLPDGKALFALDEGTRTVTEVFFVEGGKELLVVSNPNVPQRLGEEVWPCSLTWYDLKSRRKARSLSFKNDLGQMLLSPDRKVLVSGSGDPRDLSVKLREPGTGKVLGEVNPLAHTALAFTPDSKRLLVGCTNAKVYSYDLATRKESDVIDLGLHRRWVRSMAVSPDGKTLVVIPPTEETIFVDLPTGAERLRSELRFGSPVRGFLFVKGGDWLLVRLYRAVVVLDPRTGKRLCRYLPVLWGCTQLVVSPDEKWLLTVPGSDAGIRVWKLSDLDAIRVVEDANGKKP